MKHRLCILLLLLACLLPFGCGGDRQQAAAESSSVWELAKRYPSTYGTIRHAYTYERNGQIFYLSIARGKKVSDASKEPLDSMTKDGLTVNLLESSKRDSDDTLTDFTYYACDSEPYRYTIGIEQSGLMMQTLLSTEEAFALIRDPHAKIEGLTLQTEEWSAYLRLDACNLEISIFPNDGGRQYRLCEDTFESRTENGESYLYDTNNDAIAYTNGTDTVVIRQSNRSGAEHTPYNTLTECKALLALLGN